MKPRRISDDELELYSCGALPKEQADDLFKQLEVYDVLSRLDSVVTTL